MSTFGFQAIVARDEQGITTRIWKKSNTIVTSIITQDQSGGTNVNFASTDENTMFPPDEWDVIIGER
jgi:hypothetical protein